MLFNDLVVAKAELLAKLLSEQFYQVEFLLNSQIAGLDLFNVELYFIEIFVSLAEKTLNPLYQVIFWTPTVILSQKVRLS